MFIVSSDQNISSFMPTQRAYDTQIISGWPRTHPSLLLFSSTILMDGYYYNGGGYIYMLSGTMVLKPVSLYREFLNILLFIILLITNSRVLYGKYLLLAWSRSAFSLGSTELVMDGTKNISHLSKRKSVACLLLHTLSRKCCDLGSEVLIDYVNKQVTLFI